MEVHLYDPQLIDHDLWEEADWYGLGYLFDRTQQEPPRVGPLFRNAQHGREIFERWRRRLGNTDHHEALRFVLVPGALAAAPDRYAVLLSTMPEGVARLAASEGQGDVGYVVTRTRVCHLPGPPSPFLLTLRQYAEQGQPYLLTPFVERDDHTLDPIPNLSILKRRLEVRPAADIAPDEPDAAVFQ